MEHQVWTRRQFLADAGSTLGAALAAAQWPAIAAAYQHAASGAANPGRAALHFLSEDEARDVDAIAAQIIPTDDTPGAREAGVLYFIDRSLSTWAAGVADPFRAGLRDFRSGFTAIQPSQVFAAADSATQFAYLTRVDGTEFFKNVRELTLLGMFALPSYGGNKDGAGWKLLGFEDTHAFAPPFGYYDRDYPGFVIPRDGT
jgi:gluconate 2-dehydrogenase gamma chain